jgi:putative membrane protein
MPSETEAPRKQFKRLHPWSLLFRLWSIAKYVIPGGAFIFFSLDSAAWKYWTVALSVPAAVGAVVLHLRYRYSLAGEELIIRTGILGRHERHIPFIRIQDIRLIQNPLHRILGVADVKIETGSGEETEATMRVLSLGVVEEIRRRVFKAAERGSQATAATTPVPAERKGEKPEAGAGAVSPVAPPPTTELLRLSLLDLVKVGLTQGRGWLVVAALLGIAWEISDLWSGADWGGLDWWKPFSALFRSDLWSVWNLLRLVLLVPAALVVIRLLSVAWAVVKLWDFTLTRRGDDLRLSTGLLTRVAATIPAHRVQSVAVSETWLQRRFRLVTVRARTAGGIGDEESDPAHRWLAPSLDRDRRDGFIRMLVPGLDLAALRWRGVDPRAARRLLTPWLLILAGGGLIIVANAGPWGLLAPALLIPLAVIDARRSAAALGYALAPGAVVFRSGWWRRRLRAVESSRIQSIRLTQSPRDRRYRMASIAIDTAGGGSEEDKMKLRYLPEDEARGLRDRLAERVARTRFRW